jgi:membrane-bound inhibitor of C-type lysozyme
MIATWLFLTGIEVWWSRGVAAMLFMAPAMLRRVAVWLGMVTA